MKCNGDCFNCQFDDCVLTDAEALVLERLNGNYRGEKIDWNDKEQRNGYALYQYHKHKDKHRDRVSAYKKEYYQKNKEKIKARIYERRARNRAVKVENASCDGINNMPD